MVANGRWSLTRVGRTWRFDCIYHRSRNCIKFFNVPETMCTVRIFLKMADPEFVICKLVKNVICISLLLNRGGFPLPRNF